MGSQTSCFFNKGIQRVPQAFHVQLQLQARTTGVVCCDQLRVLDRSARKARKVDTLPAKLMEKCSQNLCRFLSNQCTTLLIEIKSTTNVQESHLKQIQSVALDLENSESICLSNDPQKRVINDVTVYPWQDGLRDIF